MIKIKFLGATRNVTGSRFLVESDDFRILVDCGLYQERDLRYRNWEDFPVIPSGIKAVILTHAHLDHCGYLPKLLREGFNGPVFCTPPTAAIARISLFDSGKIQEEDAAYKKKRHKKEKRKASFPERPLYTVEDAEKVLSHFEVAPYRENFPLNSKISARFYDAGHILGSAMLELRITDKTRERILIFSGDIGRWNNPLLEDPEVFQRADYVVMESTYGNRRHEAGAVSVDKLAKIIARTKQAGGNLLIPSFAIERAQEVLFYLKSLFKKGVIPSLMVVMDSPMAINVTEVYQKFPRYLDDNTEALIKSGDSPFDFPLLRLTRSTAESKAINQIKSGAVIIAGSGMCTGGRIKHHLAHNISRPESAVLFVGYQAQGTLGRELLEQPPEARILGQVHPVRAKIEKINGFSAHADQDELLRWVSGFTRQPDKIFIVHGEEETIMEFAAILREKFESEIIVPEYLEEHVL